MTVRVRVRVRVRVQVRVGVRVAPVEGLRAMDRMSWTTETTEWSSR